MPDWTPVLRQRLRPLGLPAAREDEIVDEFSGHLDDVYAHCIRQAHSAKEAVDLTLREIPDWVGLRREIRRAERTEGEMNQRTKRFWLPGLVTSAAFWGLFFALRRIGPDPQFIWRGQSSEMILYWPWYVLLPVAGALGAYCSRRAGGNSWVRVVAGLFPAVFLVTLMSLSFFISLFVDPQVSLRVKLPALLAYLVGWGAVPGVPLLLGALPFLSEQRAPRRA